MAGELQAQHVSGATLYATILNAAGAVWNGAAFDTSPTAAEWSSYDVALVEGDTTGYYRGDLPAVGAGLFRIRIHKQLGGAPASTDPVIWTDEHDTRLANLDAPISNAATAAEAQAAAAAALAAYDPPTHAELVAGLAAADDAMLAAIAALNDLSLNEVEDAIAAGSGATPATFWGYTGAGGRTLTQSGAQVAAALVSGSAISIARGDTIEIALTGLGSMAGRTALWFTVKARPESETDAQAKLQITEEDGLLRLNGAAAGDAAGASLVVDDETDGDITITLTAETSAALAVGGAWRWDVQVAQPGPGVWTPRTGDFTVRADVTRAVE